LSLKDLRFRLFLLRLLSLKDLRFRLFPLIRLFPLGLPHRCLQPIRWHRWNLKDRLHRLNL